MAKIETVQAREILDSRGNPTVEVQVTLSSGEFSVASTPSGTMTGSKEALELRDKDFSRYEGLGVMHAVENINQTIAPRLYKKDPENQEEIDQLLIDLDGTPNKAHFGANSLTALSFAVAKSAAIATKTTLYYYLRRQFQNLLDQTERTSDILNLPRPMFNIINGGAHANNNLSFQEFMVIPIKKMPMKDMIRMGAEIDHALKRVLKKYKLSVAVGDEGGYAPELDAEGFAPNINSDEEAIELILEAVEDAHYRAGIDVALGLDIAASKFWEKSSREYELLYEMQIFDAEALLKFYLSLIDKYPISYLEDGFAEVDSLFWQQLTNERGHDLFICADDFICTDITQLEVASAKGYLNTVVVKPNQVGTITEVLRFAKKARDEKITLAVSHRSGETMDSYIVDLAVALDAKFLKAGAPCRGERVVKYNRLMAIDDEVKTTLSRTGMA